MQLVYSTVFKESAVYHCHFIRKVTIRHIETRLTNKPEKSSHELTFKNWVTLSFVKTKVLNFGLKPLLNPNTEIGFKTEVGYN